MMYWIWLKSGIYADSILPGLIPERVFDLMVCSVVEKELELCRICEAQGCRAHVIEERTGRKFCPVLFADAVKPEWKVEDVK
jgi:hypothetical protein